MPSAKHDHATRHFALLLNARFSGEPAQPGPEGAPRPDFLRIPKSPCRLVLAPGAPLRIEPGASPRGQDLVLEPIRIGHQDQLLLDRPPGRKVQINAAPAPRLSVLEERDELRLETEGAEVLLHVSSHVHSYLGPAGPGMIGRGCSLCQIEIQEGAPRVYQCPMCGEPLHAEDQEHKSVDGPFECLQSTTNCPGCNGELALSDGLTFVPEELLSA